MVVSIGHFDTDQDEFVIEGRLHNGAAVREVQTTGSSG